MAEAGSTEASLRSFSLSQLRLFAFLLVLFPFPLFWQAERKEGERKKVRGRKWRTESQRSQKTNSRRFQEPILGPEGQNVYPEVTSCSVSQAAFVYGKGRKSFLLFLDDGKVGLACRTTKLETLLTERPDSIAEL